MKTNKANSIDLRLGDKFTDENGYIYEVTEEQDNGCCAKCIGAEYKFLFTCQIVNKIIEQ